MLTTVPADLFVIPHARSRKSPILALPSDRQDQIQDQDRATSIPASPGVFPSAPVVARPTTAGAGAGSCRRSSASSSTGSDNPDTGADERDSEVEDESAPKGAQGGQKNGRGRRGRGEEGNDAPLWTEHGAQARDSNARRDASETALFEMLASLRTLCTRMHLHLELVSPASQPRARAAATSGNVDKDDRHHVKVENSVRALKRCWKENWKLTTATVQVLRASRVRRNAWHNHRGWYLDVVFAYFIRESDELYAQIKSWMLPLPLPMNRPAAAWPRAVAALRVLTRLLDLAEERYSNDATVLSGAEKDGLLQELGCTEDAAEDADDMAEGQVERAEGWLGDLDGGAGSIFVYDMRFP